MAEDKTPDTLERMIEELGGVVSALKRLEQPAAGGEDTEVEAHLVARWSDEKLKQAITQLEDALSSLRALETEDGEDADVKAHRWSGYSDENLKQAIAQLEDALASLRALEPQAGEDADVEAHRTYWSDESLKQAITQLENALAELRKLSEQQLATSR